ncbi:hypothetical protein LPC10_17750 [Methylorubrum sp. B1-46]|uniref:hypothetical protein n=1 Tax=Methylorubrum TaxID=2282523 RepID=UPI001E62DAEC|nr:MULTISPECIES: hypothetical protein [Methylorubrum]MCG5246863.1 hypothetical protein [Methylorubrum extorquens]UGB24775.1 hypothetical protein LPC10_17750 [Methylorubrum sp. B1-46]
MRRRSGPEATVMRECALFMWAGGRSAAGIAEACGINTNHVYVLACLARRAGDPRAHRRPPGKRAPESRDLDFEIRGDR